MERSFERQDQNRRRQEPQRRARDWGEQRRNEDSRRDSYRGSRYGRDFDQERYDRNDYQFRDEFEDRVDFSDDSFETDYGIYDSDRPRGRYDEGRGMSSNQYGSQSGNWNRSGRGGDSGRSRSDYGYGSQSERGLSSDRGFSDRGFPERNVSAGSRSSDRGFSGRGPKGYQRSDERIREEVCECLSDDPSVDASSIEVKVSNCEVTLSGTVDERRMKRLAEDIAERISGVKDVRNEIRVQSANSMSENQLSSSSKGSEKPTRENREAKSTQTGVAH